MTAHRRGPWLVWLQVVLAVLFVYGLVLVVAGSFAQSLFTLLGFGPPASIESTELTAYLRLPFAVLGAVMAGWAAMMLILVLNAVLSHRRVKARLDEVEARGTRRRSARTERGAEPTGTLAHSVESSARPTTARRPPNHSAFCSALGSKPRPCTRTSVPTGPCAGMIESILGTSERPE